VRIAIAKASAESGMAVGLSTAPSTETAGSWHDRRVIGRALSIAALGLSLAGCADDEPTGPTGAGGSGGGSGGAPSWPTVECDVLVPSHCGYPFPSNVRTVDDPSTPTGRRLSYSAAAIPAAKNGAVSLPDPINVADGFSPSGALLALLPGATALGLPRPDQIEASLAPDSPTVLLDAETGERVPHFAELDVSLDVEQERALSIRPVVRLEDSRRYIVAIRGIEGQDGPIEPSPAFHALRDDLPFDEDPSIDARRSLYDDIFAKLADAGVARDDLLLAWDFTTRSEGDITGWLLHMRDEALEIVGEDGPTYTIDSVATDLDADIAFHITGRMHAPLYLDQTGAGAKLLFGADGMPEPNPEMPTHDVEFELMIPKSAETEPAKLLIYGHGLLGSKSQLGAGHFREFMNAYGYAFFGTNLVGMSADGDSSYILDVISSGEMHRIERMFDRMHQGALNHVLLMRMMSGRFAKDPTYGKYVNPTQRYYHGISQGGIFGGVFMAIAPDVERGVLEVMGQPYSLLLNRSVDFGPFFALLAITFPETRDQQLLLALIQILWERVEPGGYTKYLEQGLPGTPAHRVLMRSAVGDHQVTTLGAHLMARAVGATHLDTGVRDIWGLPKSSGPIADSAYVEYDFGLPPEPLCNKPMTACDDPHGKIRDLPFAQQELDHFLRTGEAENFCPGGVCSFPELGGCDPNQPYVDPCSSP
jgi:hypothetical protein